MNVAKNSKMWDSTLCNIAVTFFSYTCHFLISQKSRTLFFTRDITTSPFKFYSHHASVHEVVVNCALIYCPVLDVYIKIMHNNRVLCKTSRTTTSSQSNKTSPPTRKSLLSPIVWKNTQATCAQWFDAFDIITTIRPVFKALLCRV